MEVSRKLRGASANLGELATAVGGTLAVAYNPRPGVYNGTFELTFNDD